MFFQYDGQTAQVNPLMHNVDQNPAQSFDNLDNICPSKGVAYILSAELCCSGEFIYFFLRGGGVQTLNFESVSFLDLSIFTDFLNM